MLSLIATAWIALNLGFVLGAIWAMSSKVGGVFK